MSFKENIAGGNMDTYKEIEEKTTKKSKQGYEGYQDCLMYYKNFTVEQLDYIELTAKLALESSKRFYEFKEIVPLFISMIALFLGIVPEQLMNNIDSFEKVGIALLGGMFLYYVIYFLIDKFSCGAIIKNKRVLLFVEQMKKEKECEKNRCVTCTEDEEKVYNVKVTKLPNI